MSILGDDLLRGEKVYLNLPNEDDVDTLTAWFNKDFEMMKWLGIHPVYPMTHKDEKDWIELTRSEADSYIFAMRSLEDDALVGTCALFGVDWRSSNAELGIVVGDANRRSKGYGSDAMRVLLRFGFMELNLHRIYLQVQHENTRGIRAYEKVGFVHEGAQRQMILREGRFRDNVYMSVLRREWSCDI